MANVNIFQNGTKSIPKGSDSQIVRVPMDQMDVGGRKSVLPSMNKNSDLAISHVPNKG